MKKQFLSFFVLSFLISTISTGYADNKLPRAIKSNPSNPENKLLRNLNNHFLSFWQNVPNHFSPELRTLVMVKIDRYGYITSLAIDKSSGNKNYDNFVLQTIMNSSPAPEFPPEVLKYEYEIGLSMKPGHIQ